MNPGAQNSEEEVNRTGKSSVKDVFACEAENCPLIFTRPGILERHRLQHHWEHLDKLGEKWFCCDICPKMYKMFQVLEKHRRLHPGQTKGSITFKPTTQKQVYNFYKTQVKQELEPVQDIVVKIEPFLPNSEDEPIKCESEENNFFGHCQTDVKTEPLEMPTDPNAWIDQNFGPLQNSNRFPTSIGPSSKKGRPFATQSVPDLKHNSSLIPSGPDLMNNQSSRNKETSTNENIQEESNLSGAHQGKLLQPYIHTEGTNLTRTRWNFFRCHRAPSEKVTQYIYRITKLAVNCEFRYFNLEAALLQSLLENVPENIRNHILDEEFDLEEAMKYTANLDIFYPNSNHEVMNPKVEVHGANNYDDAEISKENSYDDIFMDSNEIIEPTTTDNLEIVASDNNEDFADNIEMDEDIVKVKYFEVNQTQSDAPSSIRSESTSTNVKVGHLNISKKIPRKPLVYCAKCKKKMHEIHQCIGPYTIHANFRTNNTNTKSNACSQEEWQKIKLSAASLASGKKIKLSQPELTLDHVQPIHQPELTFEHENEQPRAGTISELSSSIILSQPPATL